MADPVSLAVNAALIAANMALTASQQFEGPRLDELKVTTADYGTAMNYVYGQRRLDGISCIWAEPLREVKRKRKTKGGKFNDYTYFGTWAVAVCDHEIGAVLRIWFDRNLVFDATGAGPISPFELSDGGSVTDYFTVYLGTDDQEPDPRMAATVDAELGVGSTPAYRGVAYIVFKDLPLEKLGNRLPQVSVEIATAGASAFPYAARTPAYGQDLRMYLSQDGTRLYWTTLDAEDSSLSHLEIWDVRAKALMSHRVVSSLQTYSPLGVDTRGLIYMSSPPPGSALRVLSEDGDPMKTVGPPDPTWGANWALFPEIDGVTVLDDIAYGHGWGTENHAWMYVYPSDIALLIDSSGLATGGCQLRFFFKDAYGGHWMLGGRGGLADDELVIKQIRPGLDQPATIGSARIVMPAANISTVAKVNGFHCKDGEDDYLIIGFGDDGGGCVVCLDWASLSITNQIVSAAARFQDWHATAVAPGSRYLWNYTVQWDYVNMTPVRTAQAGDWNPDWATLNFTIYDRLSNALILAVGYENEVGWLYLDRASGDGVTLQSIVEDVAERCGLDVADDIDASDLTQLVPGYSWTQGQGKAILEPLLEACDSDVRPHDFKLEFLRRGGAVLGEIPVADMGAGEGARYEVTTTLDTDLPRKANLTFADLDKDQQPNTAIAQRSGQATDSRRELSLDLTTLALDADAARPIVDGYLRRAWMKAQETSLSLTRGYSRLEPADAYTLQLDDVTRAAKLTRLEFGANGVLTCQWERYSPAVHGQTALPGVPGDGLEPSVIPVFGFTKGLFLDIPLVRDADDGLIGYLAAAPYSDGPFPGASFERSADGETYDIALGDVASTEVAEIGAALSVLPDALATVWDEANTVTVRMFSGELTSATKAEVANGVNRALLGQEIIGFRTATLVADKTYELSGLHRGRRGTEWATGGHALGDRFVVLDSLPRTIMGASDVGDSFFVRPRTNGGSAGFPQEVDPYTGAALKPYAPAHLAVVDDGGDLVATWTRRARIGGIWRDFQDVPLGEGSEAYVVQILDAGGDVLRTYSGLSAPTATYDAADQATDGGLGVTLRAMQVSATVGNGFAADAAI